MVLVNGKRRTGQDLRSVCVHSLAKCIDKGVGCANPESDRPDLNDAPFSLHLEPQSAVPRLFDAAHKVRDLRRVGWDTPVVHLISVREGLVY